MLRISVSLYFVDVLLHSLFDHILHEAFENALSDLFLIRHLTKPLQLSKINLNGYFKHLEPISVFLELQMVEVLTPRKQLCSDESFPTEEEKGQFMPSY